MDEWGERNDSTLRGLTAGTVIGFLVGTYNGMTLNGVLLGAIVGIVLGSIIDLAALTRRTSSREVERADTTHSVKAGDPTAADPAAADPAVAETTREAAELAAKTRGIDAARAAEVARMSEMSEASEYLVAETATASGRTRNRLVS